jgi:acyl carrier protein
MTNRETILMDYIKNELLHGRHKNFTEKDDLLESGILNSLGILQIVAYVEDNLDLDIPSEDVVYENFHSVSALATYLDNLEE